MPPKAGKAGTPKAAKPELKSKKSDANLLKKRDSGSIETEAPKRPSTAPSEINYTKEDIKWKFDQLDKDGDGKLSKRELTKLLRKGNEDFTDEEIDKLWESIDHDGDGVCDFDEFVDYVFSATGVHGSASKPDWKGAKKTYDHFAKGGGSNRADLMLSCREFEGLCMECLLFDDDQFDKPDAYNLFKQVEPVQEARGINFEQFKKLIKLVAAKKNMPLPTAVAWIGCVKKSSINETTSHGT